MSRRLARSMTARCMLAVLAKHYRIPFYVVAPRTTFDVKTRTGAGIPIEERPADEVRGFAGHPAAPRNVAVFNPAFDVTPHELISGIVTEYGTICKPYAKSILRLASQNRQNVHKRDGA